MLSVSLDQNFLSEFAKGKTPEAMRLHAVLEKGVAVEKLVCPLHAGETVFESALCPAELREKIFSVARFLSRGVGFRNFAISAAIETLQLARPKSSLPAFLPDSLEIWIDGDLAQMGVQNRAAKGLYQERIAAQLEWDCIKSNRQTKPNDHFDLWRLAVSLNFADVVFCDAAMQSLAFRAKLLDSPSAARVFSFRQLAEAIALIEDALKV